MTFNKHKLTLQHLRPMCTRMTGLTLVEMMIAMVLGLAMMAGIISLYVNVGETATYLNATSRIQENGRFAIGQIVRTMRMAGYDDPVTTATTRPTPVMEGKPGSDITMTGFTIKSASDALLIRHEGIHSADDDDLEEFVRDCLGKRVYADTWVTNIYAISSANELVCNTITTVTGVSTTATGQVIAEGIESLNVLYGVDTDDPSVADGIANHYVTAADVTDWATVVSAKLALLVNSVQPVPISSRAQYDCESCEKFDLQDYEPEPEDFDPATDNLMRAEFQATISFRNSLGDPTT